MFLLILEILTILSYMINGYLGFGISIIMFLIIWIKKDTVINKLISSLILSVPIYNIGILGMNMHHIFSWYIIFLVLYNAFLVKKLLQKEYKLSKKMICYFLLLITILTINLFLKDNISSGIADFLQVTMLLFTTLLTFEAKSIVKTENKQIVDEWLKKINISIVAMAICTIIQCVVYNIIKIPIGYMTVFPKRITYDLLFKGYSVLSMVLGIGMIISVNNISLKKSNNIINIISLILCMIGALVNSSRTGLIAAIIIISYIIINNLYQYLKNCKMTKKQLIKITIISVICIAIVFVLIFMAMQIRRKAENVFSDNGRFNTYKNAIVTIFSSIQNFFIGNGLSEKSYQYMLPHNFILETLLKLGIFFTIITIYLLVKLLKYINNNCTKYIIWQILIASMLITGFYEMSFIILYIVISIISTQIYNNVKIGEINENTEKHETRAKSSNNNNTCI